MACQGDLLLGFPISWGEGLCYELNYMFKPQGNPIINLKEGGFMVCSENLRNVFTMKGVSDTVSGCIYTAGAWMGL